MKEMRYMIGVVSLSHVRIGVAGGFMQLNHGKKQPLQTLHAGDGIIFYSPRTNYPDGKPYQKFTAIGKVETGEIYQVDMGSGFKPFRLDVDFLKSDEADIIPLLAKLSFIKNKTRWGAAFRFGHLKISAQDFKMIAAAMGCNFEQVFLA